MVADLKKFSSWKFNWTDALLVGAEGPELRIAQFLLQCCNAGSAQINPSMKYMAHMLNLNVRSVERAVGRLEEMGVLVCRRNSRHQSYQYSFQDEWMEAALQVRLRLSLEWQAKKSPDNVVG